MRILLPIDGSGCSKKTLEWVANTFDKTGAEYYLLVVIPVLADLNAMEHDIMDAMAVLNQARAELDAQGCTVVKAEYRLGGAVDQICDFADEMNVDQVVMGTHGRTRLSRLLMGSISEGVLKHCRRPVVVFRNVEAHPDHQKPESAFSNTIL